MATDPTNRARTRGSRTAELVAVSRARHLLRHGRPYVFEDPFAKHFVGDRWRRVIGSRVLDALFSKVLVKKLMPITWSLHLRSSASGASAAVDDFVLHCVLRFALPTARQMSTLSIRLSDDLDERLSEESRLAGQPKSLLARTALEQFLAGRRRERFLARLASAAAAMEADAAELAEEALPFDNESLALVEGRLPSAESPASGSES